MLFIRRQTGKNSKKIEKMRKRASAIASMESTVVIVVVIFLLVDSSFNVLYGVTPFKQVQTVYIVYIKNQKLKF